MEAVVVAVVLAVVVEAVVGEVEVASEGAEAAGASEVAVVVVVSEGEDIKCNVRQTSFPAGFCVSSTVSRGSETCPKNES